MFKLTLYTPTKQNGQTHSNNSSTVADKLSELDHFVGLALKGLTLNRSVFRTLSNIYDVTNGL